EDPCRRPSNQPRAQRERAPVRAEPPDRESGGRRRREAHSRLHAVSAVGQGHQGGIATSVREAIVSSDAPKAIGPYSQAIRAGQLLFLSGQIPLDPASGQLVDGDIAAQTRRVMENLGAVLNAAGLSFAAVVRTTIYLADMNDFAAVNEAYGGYFTAPAHARATVQVARLPKATRVVIDAVAS